MKKPSIYSKKLGQKPRSVSKQLSAVRLILFNKPYGVLPHFTDQAGRMTLGAFITLKGVYAAGRLDRDSEGLLVLTNDGQLQARLTQPRFKLRKQYYVQVEGCPTDEELRRLAQGIELKDGPTLPCKAQRCNPPSWLWARLPPIRQRKLIPTQWLVIELQEGRNRQVRRMTAHIGYPTLRLIRYAVGPWQLGQLQPGEWKSVKPSVGKCLF